MLWRLLSLFEVAEEEAVVTDDFGGEWPGHRHHGKTGGSHSEARFVTSVQVEGFALSGVSYL